MGEVIDAIFEDGVFKPLQKVRIKEHEKFQIILTKKITTVHKTKSSLDGIIDIAVDCYDADLSTNHDKYLYGDNK